MDPPSPGSETVHPYEYWTKNLLWLISDDITGGLSKSSRGTDWKGAEKVINAAKHTLATELWKWREDRKEQLSAERYAGLRTKEAQAWCQWLQAFRSQVKSVSAEYRESFGVNVGITEAAAVIVSFPVVLVSAVPSSSVNDVAR